MIRLSSWIDRRRMMPELVSRGRHLVAAFLWLELMLASAVILLAIAFHHRDAALQRFIALLAESFLMYSLWSGSNRARWFYCGAKVVAIGLLLSLWRQNPDGVSTWILLPLILVFAGTAWLLACSKSIMMFQAFQRGELAEEHGRSAAGPESPVDRNSASSASGGAEFGRPAPADRADGVE